MRFRRWDADDGSRLPLLDVKFVDGVLRMALQTVNEKTGYILRNVLAYEQKYYRTATSASSSYVTTYVKFMSQLLSSPEDVALLSRRGVIKHLLGNDDDVCALFRGLADGLVFDPDAGHYLNPVGLPSKLLSVQPPTLAFLDRQAPVQQPLACSRLGFRSVCRAGHHRPDGIFHTRILSS